MITTYRSGRLSQLVFLFGAYLLYVGFGLQNLNTPHWRLSPIAILVGLGFYAFARMLGRADAEKGDEIRARGAATDLGAARAAARHGERVPRTLYLRGFETTGRLMLENENAPHDLFSLNAVDSDPYVDVERLLAEALDDTLPLLALGRPGEHLGAARLKTSERRWRRDLVTLATACDQIVLWPSSRPGTLWEFGFLLRQRLLGKTIMLMPPYDLVSARGDANPEFDPLAGWEQARTAIRDTHAVELPAYDRKGALLLIDPVTAAVTSPFSFPRTQKRLRQKLVEIRSRTGPAFDTAKRLPSPMAVHMRARRWWQRPSYQLTVMILGPLLFYAVSLVIPGGVPVPAILSTPVGKAIVDVMPSGEAPATEAPETVVTVRDGARPATLTLPPGWRTARVNDHTVTLGYGSSLCNATAVANSPLSYLELVHRPRSEEQVAIQLLRASSAGVVTVHKKLERGRVTMLTQGTATTPTGSLFLAGATVLAGRDEFYVSCVTKSGIEESVALLDVIGSAEIPPNPDDGDDALNHSLQAAYTVADKMCEQGQGDEGFRLVSEEHDAFMAALEAATNDPRTITLSRSQGPVYAWALATKAKCAFIQADYQTSVELFEKALPMLGRVLRDVPELRSLELMEATARQKLASGKAKSQETRGGPQFVM